MNECRSSTILLQNRTVGKVRKGWRTKLQAGMQLLCSPLTHTCVAIVRYGFGLPPFEEIHRFRERPSEILENPQTLGEHIKRERQKRKLRQKDVGEVLGVCSFTVSNWEKGYDKPLHPSIYPKIIAWLGYDPFPKPETEGEELKQARLRQGMTAQEAADEVGVDQGTWLRFENGGSVLPETRRRLLRYTKSTFHLA